MKRPIIYILTGLPGTGKSTWRNEFIKNNDFVVVSVDDYIDEVAKSKGVTYDEVYFDNIGTAGTLFNEKLNAALKAKKNIVCDRTNLSVKSRRSILARVPKVYYKISILFELPDEISMESRINRSKLIGKSISEKRVNELRMIYVKPSIGEDFDELQTINWYKEKNNHVDNGNN